MNLSLEVNGLGNKIVFNYGIPIFSIENGELIPICKGERYNESYILKWAEKSPFKRLGIHGELLD